MSDNWEMAVEYRMSSSDHSVVRKMKMVLTTMSRADFIRRCILTNNDRSQSHQITQSPGLFYSLLLNALSLSKHYKLHCSQVSYPLFYVTNLHLTATSDVLTWWIYPLKLIMISNYFTLALCSRIPYWSRQCRDHGSLFSTDKSGLSTEILLFSMRLFRRWIMLRSIRCWPQEIYECQKVLGSCRSVQYRRIGKMHINEVVGLLADCQLNEFSLPNFVGYSVNFENYRI